MFRWRSPATDDQARRGMTVSEPLGHDMRVYKFAVYGDLPQEAIDELYRANALWNQFVEVHQAHEGRVAEVWAEFPQLAALNAQIAEHEGLVAELREEAAEARKQARSTKIPSELRERVKVARAELAEAKATRRRVKEATYEAAKPALAATRNEMNASVKALYRTAVDGGLYWATYNDVLLRFRTAQKELSRKRSQGLSVNLRFHRWSGEGTIAVQLQRGADQVVPSPSVVADPLSPWKNVMSLTPAWDPVEWDAMTLSQKRKARHGELRFRVGSGDHATHVTVPVIVHRPIPPVRTEGPLVAVHVGWRSLRDGATRVAVISGVKDPVPRELREAGVVRDHGHWMEVVVPGPVGKLAGWAPALTRTSTTRGGRERHLDAIRADLVEWLVDHPEIEEPEAAHVKNWKSARRFAMLHKEWNANPPEGTETIRERLHAWYLQDMHLWRWEADERDTILKCRDDSWKKVAAWICKSAGLIRLDGWNVTLPAPPVEDPDSWQDRLARAKLTIAAPATLRNAIAVAASVRGIQVQRVDGPVSQTHYGCGGILDAEERKASIMVRCSECGLMVDQDLSALDHLVSASASVR
jgi:hypothetical protein